MGENLLSSEKLKIFVDVVLQDRLSSMSDACHTSWTDPNYSLTIGNFHTLKLQTRQRTFVLVVSIRAALSFWAHCSLSSLSVFLCFFLFFTCFAYSWKVAVCHSFYILCPPSVISVMWCVLRTVTFLPSISVQWPFFGSVFQRFSLYFWRIHAAVSTDMVMSRALTSVTCFTQEHTEQLQIGNVLIIQYNI